MIEASHEYFKDQAAARGKRLRVSSMVNGVCDALTWHRNVVERL
jgi:hypothetical protein